MGEWQPGGNGDVVSFGADDEPASSSRRARLVLAGTGGAVGVLVGGFLGYQAAGEDWWAQDDSAAIEPTAVAGAVEKVSSADENGPAFGLPLHNGADETVEVTAIRFDDLDSELVAVQKPSLPPGSWRSVQFAAPADCSHPDQAPLASVHLTLQTADGEDDARIALPGGGQAVLDYHAAVCQPQVMPRVRDLVGVWVVEEAVGSQDFVGVMVWRFEADGTFTADPEGLALLDVKHGVEGRYSLTDEHLLLDVDGGYGCDPGNRSVWRPSLVAGPPPPEELPRMTVAWVGGTCPDDMEGQVWYLRKVIEGVE